MYEYQQVKQEELNNDSVLINMCEDEDFPFANTGAFSNTSNHLPPLTPSQSLEDDGENYFSSPPSSTPFPWPPIFFSSPSSTPEVPTLEGFRTPLVPPSLTPRVPETPKKITQAKKVPQTPDSPLFIKPLPLSRTSTNSSHSSLPDLINIFEEDVKTRTVYEELNTEENYALGLFKFLGGKKRMEEKYFNTLEVLNPMWKIRFILSEPLTAFLTQSKEDTNFLLGTITNLVQSYPYLKFEGKQTKNALMKYSESGSPERFYNLYPTTPEIIYKGTFLEWTKMLQTNSSLANGIFATKGTKIYNETIVTPVIFKGEEKYLFICRSHFYAKKLNTRGLAKKYIWNKLRKITTSEFVAYHMGCWYQIV